jgi:hemerythrin superfamily protein
MDLFTILKTEHAEVKKALKKAEETTARAAKTRTELFATIYKALSSHAKAEERSLYNTLIEEKGFHDLMLEAEEEHHVADRLLEEIKKTPVDDDRWKAKITVLRESLEHHIEEEEEELFPKAKKILSKEEIATLAQQFLEEKERVLQEISL